MLREATEADADAIALVEVRAWQAAYQRALGVEFLNELSVGLRASAWAAALDGAVVAEQEGHVVGVARAVVSGATAEIAAVYVDPLHWQRGIGRELLEDGFARIASEPWAQAHAWLFLHNAMGRAFFARFGFRMDGAKRDHEASGSQEVRMRLERATAV